jgi:hypothetical protein
MQSIMNNMPCYTSTHLLCVRAHVIRACTCITHYVCMHSLYVHAHVIRACTCITCYVCMHMYQHADTCMYASMADVHTYIHTCVHACAYICMYMHVFSRGCMAPGSMYIDILTYIRTYVYVHDIHTYVFVHAC